MSRAAARKQEPEQQLVVVYRPLADLIPYARNSRVHSDAQIAQIAASIREFSFTNPVLTDELGGIIAGHGRVLAARQLGLEQVPCIMLVGLSEVQKRAYVIADNKLALNAGWDEELLAVELQGLADDGFDFALTGFDQGELDALLKQVAPDQPDPSDDSDDVPEPPKNPVTKPGDVWQLGRHLLVCGDATDAATWRKLPIVDAVFTSPPYALGIYAGKLRAPNGTGDLRSAYPDFEDTPEQWPAMMHSFTTHALERASLLAVNVQSLAGNKRALLRWAAHFADHLVDLAVWVKDNSQPAMNPGVLNSLFELLYLYGPSGSTRALPFADFRGTVTNVYNGPAARASDKVSDEHGAVFPMHLPTFVMRDLASQAKTWIDCFAGTGTSISCAEQLGRTCHGIELSPAYCDVIVQRWETLTGLQATRG
jgi:hypothetical protein